MTTAFLGLLLFVAPIPSSSILEKGDEAFSNIHYSLAEAMYDSALATSSDSADILWRLARLYICKADISPIDERLVLYRLAEAFAQRCIVADSLKSEGHTWRAAALGSIALFEGGKTKIRLCYLIKKELDNSIRLNPADDIAYSILGSYYMALGNVSWIERQLTRVFLGTLPDGGYNEAECAFKRAIALSPNIIRHRFELGDLYTREDRTKEALEQFQTVISLPKLIANDWRTQQSAMGLIKELNRQ